MKTLYNKTHFDTKGWEREEHFHYFRSFTQPFFNVHTEIDITKLYHYAKWERLSISLAFLHATTESIRAVENFLLRLEGDEVVRYEAVDISTTVLKDNKTISFVHLPYHKDLHTFCREGSMIIAEVKTSDKLFHGYNGPDLVHASTLPWFEYHGMVHAHQDASRDAIPKLAFGRLEWKNWQAILPVSVQVHHALADGYHIHQFLEMMKANINDAGCSGKVRSRQGIVKEWQLKSCVRYFFDKVVAFVFPDRGLESPDDANTVSPPGMRFPEKNSPSHP